MIPSLNVIFPKNLNEALSLLSDNSDSSKIIAGGTDIIPGLNQELNRFKEIKNLIDVNQIPELKGIIRSKEKISIGAAETFSDILQNDTVRELFPLLWKAASGVGSVQIRNRATIAGNFVNNAPCADSVPALLIYNATLEIESLSSKKEISLNEFLSAPYRTKLNRDEIVTKINIPFADKNFTGEFFKLGRRRAVAISRITLALLVDWRDSVINEIRIASGAVTPIGARFFELEKYCSGKKADDQFKKDLSRKLAEQIIKVTGLRWSSEYKLPVVQQVCYQMLKNIESQHEYGI